ncbi:hypothetical protein D3C79_827040 [compost metagenome]
MNAVAIQRWLLGNAVTLTHLAQQPLTPRAIDTGQADHARRDAAGQCQPFSLQHHTPGIALRLGGSALLYPLAAFLRIHTAA